MIAGVEPILQDLMRQVLQKHLHLYVFSRNSNQWAPIRGAGHFLVGGGEVPLGNSLANIVRNCCLGKLVGVIFSGNWKKDLTLWLFRSLTE